MNRKVLNKVLALIILVAMTLLFIGSTSMASYLTVPTGGTESNVSKKAANVGGMVLAVVQAVGVAVAIIMLIAVAIKYMSSAPNDRAEIKKHAVVYVVGAVLLFAASGLIGIIRTFSKNTFEGGTGTGTGTGTQQGQQGQQGQDQQATPVQQVTVPGGPSVAFE